MEQAEAAAEAPAAEHADAAPAEAHARADRGGVLRAGQPRHRAGARGAGLGEGLALLRDADRGGGRLLVLHRATRRCRWRWRGTSRCSTASCSTSGTSTRSTSFLFVRPARWLGNAPVEGGRHGHHRRHAERDRHGDRALVHPARGARAVGLSLPLRLRHGAGTGHPDALARPRERGAEMNSLLSLVTFLPLIGAVVLLRLPARRGRAGAEEREAAGALHHHRDLRHLALRALRVRRLEPGLPVRRGAGLDRRAHLQDGGRRHLGAVRDADHLPHAADDRGELGGDGAGQGVHGRVPDARDADARRVHARSTSCSSTSSSRAA